MTRILRLAAALLTLSFLIIVLFTMSAKPGRSQATSASTPFAAHLCTFVGTVGCAGVFQTVVIPTGSRTVIQQASGICQGDGQGAVVVTLNATVSGTQNVATVLPQVPNAAIGTGFVIPATQVDIYPDSGTTLRVDFPASRVFTNPLNLSCQVSVVGYRLTP